jgi:mannose-6-phosphate isomerase-like protein (cupin superfamily)
LLGGEITLLTTAADTEGQLCQVEYKAPPRFAGPPPHWHANTTETFYVLEGVMTFQYEDRVLKAGPGSFVRIPPGVVHKFSNEEDVPARFLGTITPGGLEGYFRELSEWAASEPVWPPADPSRLIALAKRYDVHSPAER